MIHGTSTLLAGLKHFQAIGDLIYLSDTHGQQIVFDEIDISTTVEREQARRVEDLGQPKTMRCSVVL